MRTSLLSPSTKPLIILLSIFICLTRFSLAQNDYVTYTTEQGETLYLNDDREPALYTREFGECQDDSVITVDRFDASYYKDNMTITFHVGGYTAVANESVMMYIGVYAYGENRFNLTFDPCFANFLSMCPINSSVPIEAAGIIPIAPADVAGIPDIALSIPDFEGQAILRIFGNSTQSQIACYSATLTNGHSFSHPAAVGSTVGVFVALAFVASAATAIYGHSLQETRKHYAHSLSIFVIFSILQHVFFTGALSMNFPSVLPAFWSNFGWASGMIYTSTINKSISQFVGNLGNITALGTPASGQTAVNLGGGYSLASIYKRALIDASTGFQWYGHYVDPGLPLPGNYSSFAGTLAELQIPASNAFLTGFVWFLILLALMVAIIILAKSIMELLSAFKLLKTDKLDFFRRHWIYCAGVVLLRSCYIAFFMLTFLSLFQFAIGGGTGVLAIAGLIFCLALIGLVGLSSYAVWYRIRGQQFRVDPDGLHLKRSTAGRIPWYGWTRSTTAQTAEDTRPSLLTLPWRHLHFKDPLERPHVHDDDDYLIKFGWLSARFRRSKWWFFSAWLIYELGRACFYGGAAGSPLTQVFGLLVWEILSLFVIVVMRPFESNRLNMLMVYFLGFSKVVSVALCSAFDPRFGLSRILTVVVGIIIIVVQGALIICMLIAIVVGCISSWMSVRRDHENFEPASLSNHRNRYFTHIEQKASDKPVPKVVQMEEEPKEPYFSVTAVKRQTKIEDDDPENENIAEDDVTLANHANRSSLHMAPSKPGSVRSRTSTTNLPYGARRHRASWSNRDFAGTFDPEQIPSGMQSRMSMDSFREPQREAQNAPLRQRASSIRHSYTNNASLVDVANAATDHPPNAYSNRHLKSKSLSHTQLGTRYLAQEEDIEERPTTNHH